MRPSAAQALRAGRALRLQMQSSPKRSMPQDMPPVAGYEPVQYKRNLPARGFRPIWYIVGVGALMGYGWYLYAKGVRELNELGREKMWARIHLIPLLTAEEDRDQVRRMYAGKERERDLLGGEARVYHSDRFVRPRYSPAPPPLGESTAAKAQRKLGDAAEGAKEVGGKVVEKGREGVEAVREKVGGK